MNMNFHSFLFILYSLFASISCTSLLDVSPSLETESQHYDYNLHLTSDYLLVFGDLQSYTLSQERMNLYQQSISWIDRQLDNKIIINAILEVGDVTENNYESQWGLFRDQTSNIASRVPYYVATGNHDYDWDNFKIKDRRSSFINKYARFPMTTKGIVAYFEQNSLENYMAILNASRDLYLLVLEFGPREEVVEWANRIVQENGDKLFVLMTHEWLTRYGERINENSFAETQFKGYSTYSTPEDVWNKLVFPNNNILCVLCGHNGFSAKFLSKNIQGREVPQILFNLQYQTNGGNGLVQLWEFPSETDSIKICAYDTINENWYMPDSTQVNFTFNSL